MAPRVFYRVEDEHSRARFIDGEGICAEDTNTVVHFANRGFTLLDQVEQHLNWANRRPTPFISTYCEESVAWSEASRRVARGKEDVRVYTIDMDDSYERAEYRDVRLLARRLGLYINDYAWNNSMYEWIFLHHVPDSAIVGWVDL